MEMQESDEKIGDAVDVPNVISENLRQIDQLLAKENIPIPERPLAALQRMLIFGLIREEDDTPVNSEPDKVVNAVWFEGVMKWITAWYRMQYGKQMQGQGNDLLSGFFLARQTPFIFHAPSSIVRPGTADGTAWVHLVDRVLEEENALDWVVNLPGASSPSELRAWKDEVVAVATDLRFIQNRITSLKPEGNDELVALTKTILPHLEQAARMVASHNTVDTIRSYWELQMAAEAGFKSLLLQQAGSYHPTHDLIKLAGDAAKCMPSFSSPCLNRFPHWRKAAEMRYGIGAAPGWETCYRDYRCILATVRKCVSGWKCGNLSDARFLLKRPSWM